MDDMEGATTEVANFIHNPEFRRLPMIRNQSVRLEINHEARLFGAMIPVPPTATPLHSSL
ncbi:hypothetical protein DPV78_003158 [Talaromyces pinophilus]|nr:hypothetical protein DPV78_003158 [Talaromyces pinophilus]